MENLPHHITKAPTGITGLDKITRGGLPAGRPILVFGGPGCGKTLLAMEFLVRGIREYDEPGLFISFEENYQDLIENCGSLGFDLQQFIHKKKLHISPVVIPSGEIVQSGSFSLEAFIIRLEHGIGQIRAKRMVIDGLETMLSALSDSTLLRKEIFRVFAWIKKKGITTIVTAEKGRQEFTRHGFEEYLSDCVIQLDHRVSEQISKRRLRVVKYRGSAHDLDEFPFIIGKTGISLFPITSLNLDQSVFKDQVSTGIKDLDSMMNGGGYFRGSTILVSGKAGTGKSTLAAAFMLAACNRNEPGLYFALEESAPQITRNMLSVGIDLNPHIQKGMLTIQAFRPSLCGLEEHLVDMMDLVNHINPRCVVMDPITNFISVGSHDLIKSMLTRFTDYIKNKGITLFFTSLTPGTGSPEETESQMSSLVDTWIVLNQTRIKNTRHRELYIIKSRGMKHSQETRELVMSSRGLYLRDIEIPEEVSRA